MLFSGRYAGTLQLPRGRCLKVPIDHHVFMMSVAAKSAMVCEPSTGRLWGLFRHLRLSVTRGNQNQ